MEMAYRFFFCATTLPVQACDLIKQRARSITRTALTRTGSVLLEKVSQQRIPQEIMAENIVTKGAGTASGENCVNAENIGALFEEHSDYLYRYALQHFKNEETAKDLVQDTFLAVARAHQTFKGDSTVRTWLTSILRHKLIDHIRKKSTSSETSLNALEERGLEKYFDRDEHWTDLGPRDWGRDPLQSLEQSEFMTIMKGCLEMVPERFRQIFLLKEWDGLSRDEISSELGVTSNNVGVILHRARIYLRDCIGSKWSEGPEET